MPSRRAKTDAYREAVEATGAILYRVDPVNIGYTPDEYSPEADRIVAMSRDANDIEELRALVVSVFDEMFWPGVCSAATATEIAVELLPVIRRLHGKQSR